MTLTLFFCFVIQDAKNNMAVLSASSKVAGLTDGGAARDDKRDQRRKKASGLHNGNPLW